MSKSSRASATPVPALGILYCGVEFPPSTALSAAGRGVTEVGIGAGIFRSRLLGPTGDSVTPSGAGELERETERELDEGTSPTSHVEYSPPAPSNPIIAGSR